MKLHYFFYQPNLVLGLNCRQLFQTNPGNPNTQKVTYVELLVVLLWFDRKCARSQSTEGILCQVVLRPALFNFLHADDGGCSVNQTSANWLSSWMLFLTPALKSIKSCDKGKEFSCVIPPLASRRCNFRGHCLCFSIPRPLPMVSVTRRLAVFFFKTSWWWRRTVSPRQVSRAWSWTTRTPAG